MPLVIIKADEVRDGEPRWWCGSAETAQREIDNGTIVTDDLHGGPNTFRPCPVAIVDRPSPPTIDPRREALWSDVFCAELLSATGNRYTAATEAADFADLALAEWDRRWGGGK